MVTRILAQIISRLFGPFTTMPLLFIYILVWQSDLPTHKIPIVLITLVLAYWVLPVALFLYFYAKRRVSDIDISKREERAVWLNPVMMIMFGAIGFLMYQDLPSMMWGMLIYYFFSIVVLSVITKVWFKVSLHIGVATAIYWLIIWALGWQWWWLIFVLPVIAWARWLLHKHTPLQLVTAFVSATLFFLTLQAFVLEFRI